jgi:hypothetical protein
LEEAANNHSGLPEQIKEGVAVISFKSRKGRVLCADGGLCYNRRAVKRAEKHWMAPGEMRGAVVARAEEATTAAEPAGSGQQEDASRYCPVCSQRLESRRCKLVCSACGYYMSCADYY